MIPDPGKENVLSKRMNKILESRIENDQDTIEALRELSTFYKENTLQARRNLRSQIEKRNLDINENFLSTFMEVKESFDCVYNDIVEMNQSLQEMTQKLQNAKSQTKKLLQKTNSLQEQKEKIEVCQNITGAFIKKFQLQPDDLAALYGNKKHGDASITPDTFKALDKVGKIHEDCKMLMQVGLQTLAVDVMEQMTLHEEGALEVLYRWTQNHCRSIDNPEFNEIIAKAVSRLQNRTVHFKYIIQEYCIYRRSYLIDEFLNALTKGGPSGNPAPIEMRAHDAQIYITDMLVWINRALPVEKQNLQMLLKFCTCEGLDNLLNEALANICEGVCQPLKIRVEKILGVPNQATILYSIVNMLRYYKKCINKLVNQGQLEETLSDLLLKSEKSFLDSLKQQINSLLVRVESPPRDLSPTTAITHLLNILRDMLSTASMSEGREIDMVKIAGTILEPLLRAVNEQASRLPPTDMAVYLLNCMYSMSTCLSMFEFMEEQLERLQAQSDAQIDTLTSEQASSLVANLSLGPIYTILQDHSEGPLSGVPGMEPSNLRNFLLKLDNLAVQPDSILLPQINLLLSSKHKKTVQKRSFGLLLAIYQQMYDAVQKPENKYENPTEILSKTPEELNKLFE
ncbi:conserved oligomeric Golgi complex subunit 6 [Anthonomus grandis grandis]|uniref:conserved oligomeric Golgi complex subunit 6 n=1 Tax=Anthonomus grandis grandis TaxID=2921223 RepID=UPI00216658C0|nr:conserved oligomeric Golgi complex subunit 6 [Anthonomus grandis grandis]